MLPCCLQARVAKIALGLGSYFACLAIDKLTGSEDNTEKVRQRAQQLRETLTELGPSFIKAGQVLANRPDIVREDYMNELCILQVRGMAGCLHTVYTLALQYLCAQQDPGTGGTFCRGSRTTRGVASWGVVTGQSHGTDRSVVICSNILNRCAGSGSSRC